MSFPNHTDRVISAVLCIPKLLCSLIRVLIYLLQQIVYVPNNEIYEEKKSLSLYAQRDMIQGTQILLNNFINVTQNL